MRRVAALLAGALVVTAGLTAAVVAPATAAPVTDFEPGHIISDSIMYDTTTMSAAAVEQFLADKGASCRATTAGWTCLKDYRETTPTRAADTLCPGGYAGGANETAGRIIAKAAAACGINPQVLVVTLQKEQGLVTATGGRAAATYARALGFGCPDNSGGVCNPEYTGFANQVYSAAKQLKRYAANPQSYAHKAGRENSILFHPDRACGSSVVVIQNQATASLYNYTPYQPNAAALAAGSGTGDACSSYGNRNFHTFFTTWFGSPKQRTPLGVVDVVRAVGASTVPVAGWAFDPDVEPAIGIHVYVDGRATAATRASTPRPDVKAIYGKGAVAGYDVRFEVSPGDHDVCVYGIDANGGTNVLLGCRRVSVVNHTPLGVIDVARAVGPDRIQVAGWAFDRDVTTAIGVHVYVDGVATAAIGATGARPDVQAIYGAGAVSGYDATVPASPGRHQVCLYAIDANGGINVLLGCRTVDVQGNRTPLGVLDIVRDVGGGQVQVAGWTFDPDLRTPISVHVYVSGRAAQAAQAAIPRPDVLGAYGNGATSGYDLRVPVEPGTHDVCTYGIDGNGGMNVLLGCRPVTVAAP